MKKVLPALILISLLVAPIVLAQDEGLVKRVPECTCTTAKHNLEGYIYGCNPDEVICDESTGVYIKDGALCCILDIMETVVDYMFIILLILAGVIIIFAAFQFTTAGGDPAKVNAARDKLIWAVAGIAVAFLSKGIVKLVEMMLS